MSGGPQLVAEWSAKRIAQLEKENAGLREALASAAAVSRDSIDSIEHLYTSLASAIGDAAPAFAHARSLIAKWEQLAKGSST